MSDEFLRVATKEINEELDSIGTILESSSVDDDVTQNSSSIEKHIHKIKGLAPMMDKIEIGKIAELVDSLLKQSMEDRQIKGIFQILKDSHQNMVKSMSNESHDCNSIIKYIEDNYSEFLD